MPTEPSRAPEREPAPRVPLVIGIFGWYGTAAIVGAYFASSHGWLAPGTAYHALNLTGALGVGLVCWWKRAWQPLSLELVWALVALSALLR